MRASTRILPLVLLCLMIAPAARTGPQSFKPKDGFVPDAKTATVVARAILSAIYGETQISQEEPLRASLRAGVWTVRGTLPSHVAEGGVAEIDISKRTGAVLRATHGK